MTTAIPLTLHLAVLIGLYEFTAGVAGVTGQINWAAMIEEFERSPALTFISGFMIFAIGGVMIMNHHHWTDALAIIVSAIGWIALIEGVLIMTLPAPLFAFSRRLVTRQRAVSLIAAVFGIILLVLGLTGRADPTSI